MKLRNVNDTDSGDDTRTMPLGTGEFSDDAAIDPLATTGRRRKVNAGAILIAIVVVVAAGGLFSMRKLAQLTAATGFDREVESTVENFLRQTLGGEPGTGRAAILRTDDEILSALKDDRTDRQVRPEDVHRNPFIIAAIDLDRPAPAERPTAAGPRGPSLEQLQEKRRGELKAAGEALRVRSILGGATPLAVIENEIRNVGDVIRAPRSDAEFIVKSIATGSVDLEATDKALGVTVTVTLFVHSPK